MAERGFHWGLYVDDTGTEWVLRVDSDHLMELGRGWVDGSGRGLAPFPRGWKPRYCGGYDNTGRRQTAVIARPDAWLWTGLADTFNVEASDQTIQVVLVTVRFPERRGQT